jgi:hypothetical protein
MAYATQDQVLNYLQGGPQNQNAGVDPTTSRPMGQSGGSGIVGSGAPSAGSQGSGGQGLWTNIQSYIGANQAGQQQRADTVKQQVQGTFGKEKEQFQQQSQQAKSSVEKATEPVRSMGQDKASQLIQQASSSEKGSEGYTQAVDPLKKAVSTQIEPAKTFSYGLGAETQDLGKSVGDQRNFQNFLSIFDKNLQGGRDLTVGQRGLQNQLDVQNVDLENARQDLSKQYGGLSSEIETGAVDANKYIQDLVSGAQTSQNELKAYLEGQGTMTRKQIDDAIAAHNAQVAKDAKTYEGYANKTKSAEDAFRDFARSGTYGAGASYKDRPDWNLTTEQVAKLNPYDKNGKLLPMDPAKAKTDPNYMLAYYLRETAPLEQGLAQSKLKDKYLGSQNAFIDWWKNAQMMPEYVKGQRADETTVGGSANQSRNTFNTIMDIFGKGGIEDKQDATASKIKEKQKWSF